MGIGKNLIVPDLCCSCIAPFKEKCKMHSLALEDMEF